MTRSCRISREQLLLANETPPAAAPHLLECAPCRQFEADLQADRALLAQVMPMRAPAGPPPEIGSRTLPILAVAEGRTLPGWWLTVPAAAAALLLIGIGVWTGPAESEVPRVAGVRVEPVQGAEWSQVLGVLSERDASGPVGPLVERVLDGVTDRGR